MRTVSRFLAATVSACLLSVAVASLPSPGEAGGGVRASENQASAWERAREHFLKGMAYLRDELWAEALDEFLLANEIQPSPSYLLDIARCYSRLGRHELALAHYEAYLEDAPPARRYMVENLLDLSRRALEESSAGASDEGLITELTDLCSRLVGWEHAQSSQSPADRRDEDMLFELAELAPLVRVDETRSDDTEGGLHAGPTPIAAKPPVGLPSEALETAESGRRGSSVTRTWWFWTAVGTLAAGTAVTAALAAGDDGSPGASMNPIDLR